MNPTLIGYDHFRTQMKKARPLLNGPEAVSNLCYKLLINKDYF